MKMPSRHNSRHRKPKPWGGLGGLFTLSVIVGPMAVLQAPLPTVLTGESLVPIGVVAALVVAVFHAGRQMQKLTDKLKLLDKLVERVAVLAQRAGIGDEEPTE